jgi:hypothetical protein
VQGGGAIVGSPPTALSLVVATSNSGVFMIGGPVHELSHPLVVAWHCKSSLKSRRRGHQLKLWLDYLKSPA